uniref:Immunoglobulin C2-set-like ligand-binding domain-containing protein n=2 Tax=Engystomops pustulosus TaxID=76066 RepID=A0AAV6YIV7_ENGPU|nr:hypothetical protein GDO81_025480 [Engystomops pustulosus]
MRCCRDCVLYFRTPVCLVLTSMHILYSVTMRRALTLCVLWSLVLASDGSMSCAYITPQSPAVELGTNLTAFCILDQECLRKEGYTATSKEIFWKVGNSLIPESQYTVVNDSVSSVTFQPDLSTHNSLICSFLNYGQAEVTLHGIFFTLGCKWTCTFLYWGCPAQNKIVAN